MRGRYRPEESMVAVELGAATVQGTVEELDVVEEIGVAEELAPAIVSVQSALGQRRSVKCSFGGAVVAATSGGASRRLQRPL